MKINNELHFSILVIQILVESDIEITVLDRTIN